MSKLTDILLLLYSYQTDDVDNLTTTLTERRKATWINTLRDLARTHGCNQYPGIPKGADARDLERQSREDALSIAATFNRDVQREIERLYAANPRGNRIYYFKRLEAWAKKRASWKDASISLNTDGAARYLATTRFYEQNPQLSRSFVAAGPPPTCKICIRIFAAGVVNLDYMRKRGLPAHINCPHFYKSAAPVRAQCGSLWLG